jgi:hypothetical protein
MRPPGLDIASEYVGLKEIVNEMESNELVAAAGG